MCEWLISSKCKKVNTNFISNIDILENVKFKELKELNLNRNNILDIKVLEKVKFEKLKILYLNGIKYQI